MLPSGFWESLSLGMEYRSYVLFSRLVALWNRKRKKLNTQMNLDLTKQTDSLQYSQCTTAQNFLQGCRTCWTLGIWIHCQNKRNHSTEKFNCTKPFVNAHLVFLGLEKTQKIHTPAQLHDGCILAAVEVKLAQEAIFYIVQHVTIHSISWTFPFQFEHQHPTVMA